MISAGIEEEKAVDAGHSLSPTPRFLVSSALLKNGGLYHAVSSVTHWNLWKY